MEELSPGTRLEPGRIQAPGEATGAEIIIESLHVEEPHGRRYRARQGASSLLLSVFDDAIARDADLSAALDRHLSRARGVVHRNLLPCYGYHRDERRFIAAREDPRCTTAQEFILKRMAKGERIELPLVCTIAAQVCDALAALHKFMPHGQVIANNVFINRKGRIFLSGAGEGQIVPLAPRFAEYVAAGLLPSGCRELFEPPREPRTATDIYMVGELVVALLSGHAAEGLQASLVAAGLNAAHPLHGFLAQALERDHLRRPADIVEFRKCLITAARARTVDRVAPPPPPNAPAAVRVEAAAPVERERAPALSAGRAPLGIPTLVMPAATFEPLPPSRQEAYDAGPPLPRPAPRLTYTPPPAPPSARKIRSSAPLVGRGRPPVTDWQSLDKATSSLPNASLDDVSEDIHAHGSSARAPVAATDTLAELGLNLSSFDDIAERLATIDGESGLLGIADARDGTGARVESVGYDENDRADGFLGSFGDAGGIELGSPQTASQVARLAAPAFEHLVERDPAERPPREALAYMLIRGGIDLGPFSMLQLIGMARRGELLSTEQLTRRTDDHDGLAVDYPELREIFEAKVELELRRTASGAHRISAGGAARSGSAGRRSSSAGRGAGTAMWILASLLLFAAAAWVLWKRSGGG